VGQTATVTTVIVHGAGSTGAAARALLGALPATVCVEDRSGEIEHIVDRLHETLLAHPDCTEVVGISLGAHAVARWAATRTRALPRIRLVLPAWLGPPGTASTATLLAAHSIASEGIVATLLRLRSDGAHPDIAALLDRAWIEYADDELARCLHAASTGMGPTAEQLAAIRGPVSVLGWMGDAFHPASVAWDWASHLRWPTIALGARPEIRLLRQALATTRGARA